MNRRQLLRDLAVFSVSAVALTSERLLKASVIRFNESASELDGMLLRAQVVCRELSKSLHEPAKENGSSELTGLRLQMREVSGLIEHARRVADQPHQQSAAFWQASADSFRRLADTLKLCHCAQTSRTEVFSEAQTVMQATAEYLSSQTRIRLRHAV